jgi:hypothetical protein
MSSVVSPVNWPPFVHHQHGGIMTTDLEIEGNHLERVFDVLLDQNCRLVQENELLRAALKCHPTGVLQIRSVERSLARAWRHCEPELTADTPNGSLAAVAMRADNGIVPNTPPWRTSYPSFAAHNAIAGDPANVMDISQEGAAAPDR